MWQKRSVCVKSRVCRVSSIIQVLGTGGVEQRAELEVCVPLSAWAVTACHGLVSRVPKQSKGCFHTLSTTLLVHFLLCFYYTFGTLFLLHFLLCFWYTFDTLSTMLLVHFSVHFLYTFYNTFYWTFGYTFTMHLVHFGYTFIILVMIHLFYTFCTLFVYCLHI